LSGVKSSQTTQAQGAEQVDKAFKAALQMMTKAGLKIREQVKVSVDPNLPIMGYTMPQEHSFQIVISGGAVRSGMLEGLLVHEMSHVYRIENNHPSHDAEILEEAVEKLESKNRLYDYQQKILYDILNDIQDLYADDLAFRVLRTSPIGILDQIPRFLQDMVVDEPVRSEDKVKDRWVNASIMAHNARAIAQLSRDHVEDIGGRARESNQKFLDKVPGDFAKEFPLFRDRLASLKEEITEDEYRTLLEEHLNQFVRLVDAN
jgi:hypothetical protein